MHWVNKFKIHSKNFRVIKEINKGFFGTVYKVEDKETRQYYAAKVIIAQNTK